MKRTVTKIVMRGIGTLAGVLGLGVLCLTAAALYESRNPWTIFFTALFLALSVYLIYVAYLVWFRFSPLAVRHICGALGFYVFTLIPVPFDPALDSEATWALFAYLGCIVAVYFAYRFASDRLIRLLFPESVSGVQS